MEEKIQQDIKPEDVEKVIADLAKLGYKVEKEETKEEKEIKMLEEMLANIPEESEPDEIELLDYARAFHPYYMDKQVMDGIKERISRLKGDKK